MNAFSKYSLELLSAIAALAVPLAFAGKPAPPPTVNVTTTVYDRDTQQNQLVMGSDDFEGLPQATYTNTGNVTTTVGLTGGWGLNLYNQSLRTIQLNVLSPVGGFPISPVLPGRYSENVEIYTHCHDANNHEIGFPAIPLNVALACSYGMDFLSGRTKYKLAMGLSPAGQTLSGPATGRVIVTCTASSAGVCNSWTIAAPNTTIANLYEFARNGSLVYVGQYYFGFSIAAVVTNP